MNRKREKREGDKRTDDNPRDSQKANRLMSTDSTVLLFNSWNDLIKMKKKTKRPGVYSEAKELAWKAVCMVRNYEI